MPIAASVSRTTIPLTKDTRDRLKALGSKGETYDELVNRLIDHYMQAQQADEEEEIEFDPVD
jgi:hypothetical protein